MGLESILTSIDWSALWAALGIGGTSIAALLGYAIIGIKKFLNVDDPSTTIAPKILQKLGGCTYQMKEEDIAWICNQLPDFNEQKIIRNEIAANMEKDLAFFLLDTSIAQIPISQGYIDVANIVYKTTAGAVKADTRSRDSDGKKIGLLSLKYLSIGSVAVVDKMKSAVSQLVGKDCTAVLFGKDYGSVIVGMFFDGKQFGEQVCYTKPGTSEIFSAKMPDHNSDYPAGEHVLEIKQGYRDGWNSYNGTPGSSGDQTTWKEELTVKFVIDVI